MYYVVHWSDIGRTFGSCSKAAQKLPKSYSKATQKLLKLLKLFKDARKCKKMQENLFLHVFVTVWQFFLHCKNWDVLYMYVCCWNKVLKFSCILANGHIMLNTPVLVRSLKLSNIEPSQYLDGWPPGNTGCCWLSFFSYFKRIFAFFGQTLKKFRLLRGFVGFYKSFWEFLRGFVRFWEVSR